MRDLGLIKGERQHWTNEELKKNIGIWILLEHDTECPCKAKGDETSTLQYLRGWDHALSQKQSLHGHGLHAAYLDTNRRDKKKQGH